MKMPFFNQEENTDAKPKRTRRVETTPNEDRVKRVQEYKKRIKHYKGRRSYGKRGE